MPQDSPRLPEEDCQAARVARLAVAAAESQQPSRPILDMTANVNALVDQVRAILDGYQAAGEVKIVVDAFGVPGVFTLHIPLPK